MDGLEGAGDIQPTDDTDYTRPFGVPETKEESLGFKDPVPRATPRYKRAAARLERWLRQTFSRIIR